VTRQQFTSIPTTARLWAAAALCVLSLGMPRSYPALAKDAPLRLLVVGAVLGLGVAALRARTPATQRLARVVTVALTVALTLALGHGDGTLVLVVALALVLAAPPAWRGSPSHDRTVMSA
jgi:hypothetical protein